MQLCSARPRPHTDWYKCALCLGFTAAWTPLLCVLHPSHTRSALSIVPCMLCVSWPPPCLLRAVALRPAALQVHRNSTDAVAQLLGAGANANLQDGESGW
jgi:hypothetical protein